MQRLFSILFATLFFGAAFSCSAQPSAAWPSPEVEQLYNQARSYLSGGNLKQAIASYQQLIPLAPGRPLVYRELSQAYYLSGNYERALKILQPVFERDRADEAMYELASDVYTAQKEDKEARNILQKGLQKFPNSGLLYHAVGRQYETAGDLEKALRQWVAGINAAPAYRLNYYDAARTYFRSRQPVWAILYAEIFVNLERQTPRSYDARKLLLQSYKKLFLTPSGDAVPTFGDNEKGARAGNFAAAVQQTFLSLAPVVADGITTENLTMLRARFLAAWSVNYGERYPYALFAYWDELLRAGQFDAYNQWLFGKADNEKEYAAWTTFHPEAVPQYEAWQSAKPLKPVATDNYNTMVRAKDLFLKE